MCSLTKKFGSNDFSINEFSPKSNIIANQFQKPAFCDYTLLSFLCKVPYLVRGPSMAAFMLTRRWQYFQLLFALLLFEASTLEPTQFSCVISYFLNFLGIAVG